MTESDFEKELEAVTSIEIEVPSVEVVEPEVMRSKISPQIADQLVYSKQVARALMEGMSIAEVAERLGVSDSVVRNRVNSGPMADLLEIEARRVMRHLSGRELDKEKYLGLSTAVCGMIDKIRLLRDEPTEIREHTVTEGTIERIKAGLFGRSYSEGSKRISSDVEEIAGEGIQSLPEGTDEGRES